MALRSTPRPPHSLLHHLLDRARSYDVIRGYRLGSGAARVTLHLTYCDCTLKHDEAIRFLSECLREEEKWRERELGFAVSR